MDKFCTNCGAELNGKSKCDKCGNVNGGVFQALTDKVKNYDYKSKVEEVKDSVTNYNYKEKAKEVTEAVKNFDYEEKAKEISDTIKNYDYKGEAENIKKGGFKYFWNKHRKLSIGIICILAIGCISGLIGNDKSTYNNVDSNVTSNIVGSNASSSETTESSNEKFIKDDDFILEYAGKLAGGYMYKYKIVDRDNYNRYLITGTIRDEYAEYNSAEAEAIIFQINDDYSVKNFVKTTTNKKMLDSLVSEMKSDNDIWNAEPFITEMHYGR